MNSLRQTLTRHTPTLARRFATTESTGLMSLNFNLPQETLYASAPVKSVVVPGAMGEYEVTADHVPIVAELKAGLLTIHFDQGESEKYFVAGGFSLTHEGSTTVRELSFVVETNGYYFGYAHLTLLLHITKTQQ
jgi:hypothetical protein